MHYYSFNIGDYRKDTTHLTPIEHYCYRTMLDTYYLGEKPLQKDIKSLARTLCLSGHEDEVRQVLSDFFIETNEGWVNKRALKEITYYHNRKISSSIGGKKTQEAKKALKANKINDDLEF